AYHLGQSYVRTFQDFLEPNVCGIVLERQHCRDDFAAVREVAERKLDAGVAVWLVDGDRERRVHDWGGLFIPRNVWREKPVFAWCYTAGMLTVAAAMPHALTESGYLSSIVKILATHDDAAPESYRGLIASSDSEPARINRLVDALTASVPATAFPT